MIAEQIDIYYMYDPEYLFSLYSTQNQNNLYFSQEIQNNQKQISLKTNNIRQTYKSEFVVKNETNQQNSFGSKSKKEPERRIRWTKEEHELFEQALMKHGRSKHKLIQKEVKTKTLDQCVSHSQKFFVQLDNMFSRGMKDSVSDATQRLIEIKFPDAFEQSLTITQTQMAAGIYNIIKLKDETIAVAYIKYLLSKKI
ncbi:Myb-like_DNA-binding domain-containing protein [Hexamita inflata]|uniref:Myb-like DNA-binding domain-containing protein n=1 Tax=Hexamita inflata TaxID=28002 RepID=A0AA86RHT0_9EUKA|nr:Myb-like DNA-binding domain-containing protein [Hexamita inflata]CAI9974601.1 Myb-like DNA-binding domain-containing protein [Hexamita inflata]